MNGANTNRSNMVVASNSRTIVIKSDKINGNVQRNDCKRELLDRDLKGATEAGSMWQWLMSDSARSCSNPFNC